MEFNDLVGKTLTAIAGKVGDDRITFTDTKGLEYALYHSQNCCESVVVEDICGDLKDLIGAALIIAEESSSNEQPKGVPKPEYQNDSFTWTFYRLATKKGSVTIRWYGSSNGYYSESVDFAKL